MEREGEFENKIEMEMERNLSNLICNFLNYNGKIIQV